MNIELTPKNAEALAKYAAFPAHAQNKAISSQFVMKLLLFVTFTFTLCSMRGVAQMPNPYGPPINLENAKKAAAPALAEARKNSWTVAVAIVDVGGNLVYFDKMDNTQIGSANFAIDKARSAALFKRTTKAFEDILAAGGDGLRVLGVHGAVPVEGGIPLLIEGNIVGAIGVSGGTSPQDGQCAKAGADDFK
jgi:glc operon protein GlcG